MDSADSTGAFPNHYRSPLSHLIHPLLPTTAQDDQRLSSIASIHSISKATTPECTMSGNGSRSRDGCFSCRRRKRRCDEEKPVCLRCRKTGDDCVFPERASASNPLKFVIAASPDHYVVPIQGSHRNASFLNLSAREVLAINSRFREDTVVSEDQASAIARDSQALSVPRVISPFGFNQLPERLRSIETSLVQYYVEVISSSRVYVQTGPNGFRTSVIPRVLYQQGPLLSAVLAMSAAEWAQNIVVDGRDYRALSMQYKVRALQELQQSLPDSQSSEGNLLTCVLLSSLEIAQGSRPTWLRHLQGALAILDNFAGMIDPNIAQFALQYFRFRYILMETTQPATPDSFDEAMAGLARAEAVLPTLQGTRGIIDAQIGCSMELVDIVNEISALSLVSGGSNDARSTDHLYTKGEEIERKLIELTIHDFDDTDEYLLKSAESFRIAAQIYLRLVCYNTAITHPSILQPHEALLSCLSDIIVEEQVRRSFPMWPLFLAGCACSSDEQRKVVLDYFTLLDGKWPISNISAVWNALLGGADSPGHLSALTGFAGAFPLSAFKLLLAVGGKVPAATYQRLEGEPRLQNDALVSSGAKVDALPEVFDTGEPAHLAAGHPGQSLRPRKSSRRFSWSLYEMKSRGGPQQEEEEGAMFCCGAGVAGAKRAQLNESRGRVAWTSLVGNGDAMQQVTLLSELDVGKRLAAGDCERAQRGDEDSSSQERRWPGVLAESWSH
ncbi:hypothetical protein ACJZ2D_015729 [Fusarium nematophilum]